MLLILAASDLKDIDADFFKSAWMFVGWLLSIGAAVWGGVKWSNKGTAESPAIVGPQPFVTKKHEEPAKKIEHDTLKEAVTKLTTELQEFRLRKAEDDLALSEQLNAQFNKMTTDGQARAAAISQEIAETLAVQNERNLRIAADIAKHTAEIESLKASDFRHTGEIVRIQEHITKLLTAPKRS